MRNADVEAAEEHVARFRNYHVAMTGREKFVYGREDLADLDRRLTRTAGSAARQVAGIHDRLAMSPQVLPQQRADEITHADVDIGVILHVHVPIDRPHAAPLDDV